MTAPRYATTAAGRRYRADRRRRVAICSGCGNERPLHAADECGPCYAARREDWPRAGLGGRGLPRTAEDLDERLREYARLRTSGDTTIRQAAAAMRISLRTAQRREAELIAAGAIRVGVGLRFLATSTQKVA